MRERGGVGALGLTDPPAEPPSAPVTSAATPRHTPAWLVRTYVARTGDSEVFGPMVAAEAHRRNFPAAACGAFVGDGAAWLGTLQRR